MIMSASSCTAFVIFFAYIIRFFLEYALLRGAPSWVLRVKINTNL